jgi:uncharacterized heparinase superfamily protein
MLARPTAKKSLTDWRNWFHYRQLRTRWWRHDAGPRAAAMTDADFKRLMGLPEGDEEAVRILHERLRLRFFFHPRNRKDFFLNTLTSLQSFDDVIREAEETVENKFDTLGSGVVDLGWPIDWQKDFKSGYSWPVSRSHQLDVLQPDRPTDVKVPWELSRFHQVWWLGKAYWLTGHDQYAQKFRSLIDSWIEANPLDRGVNWVLAMEAAIRACNWVAGYAFFCEARTIPASFWIRFFRVLYQHGLFVEHNLEYAFVRGNHFLSNLTGLVTLGLVFKEHEDGRRWYEWATRQLEVEMGRQVYLDGVDWEKSTSYQRLVLELFAVPTLLAERHGHTFSPAYLERLHAMFRFIAAYQRPDGTIPLVGDADDGRLFRFRRDEDINDLRHILSVGAIRFDDPVLRDAAGGFTQDALWYWGGEGFERFRLIRGASPTPVSQAFPEGGFYVLRSASAHVFFDAGEIGLGGKGGHGHNDTLSFELWIDGAPLIVDPGTYAYTSDVKLRQALRGTASHNTVMVDGVELAEFAGLWNVADDPTRVEVEEWSVSDRATVVAASHRAYERLHVPTRHRRKLILDQTNDRLFIEDVLEGEGQHTAIASFHLAPSVRARVVDERMVELEVGGKSYWLELSAGRVRVESAIFSRSFGKKEPTRVVRVELSGSAPMTLRTVIGR